MPARYSAERRRDAALAKMQVLHAERLYHILNKPSFFVLFPRREAVRRTDKLTGKQQNRQMNNLQTKQYKDWLNRTK